MELFDWCWEVDHPKAVIALVHGAGEYCGRYDRFARELNEVGYSVYGTDMPGQGKSGGRRGHVDAFETYLKVVDRLLDQARERNPDVPLILFGHSMGGLVVVRYLQTRINRVVLDGVILSSPCLELAFRVSPLKARLARWTESLWPTLTQASGTKPENVSRSQDIVHLYATDPLVVRDASARWYMEFRRAMDAAQAEAARSPAPTLVLQAGQDRLVSPDVTMAYAERLVAPRKRFVLFDASYHELLNEPEPERGQALAEILAWISDILSENGIGQTP